jgi:hypothetical protein
MEKQIPGGILNEAVADIVIDGVVVQRAKNRRHQSATGLPEPEQRARPSSSGGV